MLVERFNVTKSESDRDLALVWSHYNATNNNGRTLRMRTCFNFKRSYLRTVQDSARQFWLLIYIDFEGRGTLYSAGHTFWILKLDCITCRTWRAALAAVLLGGFAFS